MKRTPMLDSFFHEMLPESLAYTAEEFEAAFEKAWKTLESRLRGEHEREEMQTFLREMMRRRLCPTPRERALRMLANEIASLEKEDRGDKRSGGP